MLFRLLLLMIYSKKLTMAQKLGKLNRKLLIIIIDHSNNYIATKEFNKLPA